MSLPAKYPISIYVGDDFILEFRLKDENSVYRVLTGWTGRAQLRDPAGGLAATFSVAIVSGTPGMVRVTMVNTSTASLTIKDGVYDVELTDTAGKVRTYLAGPATIVPDVTRT